MELKYLLLKFVSATAAVLLAISLLCSCGLFYFNSDKNNKLSDNDLLASQSSNLKSSSLSSNEDENKYTGRLQTEELDFFKVTEVIDGDTFKIENSEKIRLIGINTPEIDMFFYEEASEVLRIIAEGKSVSLAKDVSERDQYGRLLRYAFYCDLFINLEMLQRGFANVYTMPPDVKYQQVFIEAERYARENNLGLWERSPYSFKISAQGQKEAAIIIEINWDAEGDDKQNMNDEYVIFINNSGADINLDGWIVKDSGTNIYKFKNYNFKNGSEIILYTGSGSDGNNKFYWDSDMPVWNNSGDTIYLRDRDGLLAQIFNY